MKKILLTFVISVISIAVFCQTYHEDFIDGRLFIVLDEEKFNDLVLLESKDVSLSDLDFLDNICSNYSITGIERPFYNNNYSSLPRTFRLFFSNYSEVEDIEKELRLINGVELVEKETLLKLFTNDPYYGNVTRNLMGGISLVYGNKWFLDQIDAEGAWAIHEGTAATRVAIIDDAVFSSHPDLNVVEQYSAASSTANSNPPTGVPTDDKYMWSHGTHCAGLVSAKSNNNIGVASIGRNLSIIGVRAANDNHDLQYTNDALSWVVTNGTARVINLSLGGPQFSAVQNNIINSAYNANMLVIAAAGNNNAETTMYPAGYNRVVAVGAVMIGDRKSDFSNYGSYINVMAPGGNNGGGGAMPTENLNMLFSTTFCEVGDFSIGGALAITGDNINGNPLQGNYHAMSGTSMACPVVAGLAGLMRDLGPLLTVDTIRYCLESTCDNIDAQNPNHVGKIGAGRINAKRAIECVRDLLIDGVHADFVGTPTSINVGNTVTFTDLSSGNPTTWNWSFPGGTPATATGQGPHIITYNTAGLYNASLTVSDGTDSDTRTRTNYIEVILPEILTANFEGVPTIVDVGNTVVFTDLTVGGVPDTWEWAFQGGTPATATGQGPHTIQYNTIGTYNARLTVSNATESDMENKLAYIRVVDPNAILADFEGVPTTLLQGNTVQFTDLSTNDPVSWQWTFNGGTPASSTQQNPLVTYSTTGQYNVTLKVTNASSEDELTKMAYITVVDSTEAPKANFIANFTIIEEGGQVDFYNYSTGYYDSLYWAFDGALPLSSTDISPAGIQYDAVGQYDVTLILYSTLGNDTLTKPLYINVIDPSYEDILTAKFTTLGGRLIVQGWGVNYEDQSIGYPTSWQWIFQGGTPGTSSQQNPQGIVYNTPGKYDVTLIVSNGVSSDTIVKDDYIVVTTQVWPDPNGYCLDTITNVLSTEIPLTFRHLSPNNWGYFPGHNGLNVRAYAEKYTHYTYTHVNGLIIPAVKSYGASSTSKIRFTVWDVNLNGLPGNVLGFNDVIINDFTPYFYHVVNFNQHIPVDGDFFVGFQLYYTAADTFVVYMAPNRGANGKNTLYAFHNNIWKTPTQLLGNALNTSMAIRVLGCLVNEAEPINWDNDLIIFPNPTDGLTYIDIINIDVFKAEFQIMDIYGRTLSVNVLPDGFGRFSFNMSEYESGIYFVKININDNSIIKKITVIN